LDRWIPSQACVRARSPTALPSMPASPGLSTGDRMTGAHSRMASARRTRRATSSRTPGEGRARECGGLSASLSEIGPESLDAGHELAVQRQAALDVTCHFPTRNARDALLPEGGDRRERHAEVGNRTLHTALRTLGDRLEALRDGGVEAAHARAERTRKGRHDVAGLV